MDTGDLEKVQDLVDAALRRPEAERAAFLDAACAGDPEVREEVRSLLELLPEATAFFQALERELGGSRVAELTAAARRRRRIGPYHILRRLGRGGMGEVYLAERADGQFEQQVAIKLVRRGFDSGEAERRFLAERQLVARLEHPNVARLLDGGVTEDGLPYFVMEHVEGEPLGEYCDRRRLTVDGRLGLFLALGEAVQYLHRNLVVHRDLKPGNVLVTSEGTLKLLDFGIAKLLEPGGNPEKPTTAAAARYLTPDYAAPEQILGEPVTTATDVFALGVILYELLTGRRPFRRGRSLGEMERAVLEEEPDRPSVAVVRAGATSPSTGATSPPTGATSPPRGDEPPPTGEAPPPKAGPGAAEEPAPEAVAGARGTTVAGLRRRLRGDLDTVCLAALRKRPEGRYRSAERMLEDVRRHLEGRPITARPATAGYRFRTFVRRNRLGVGTAAAILALSLGFTSLTIAQSARAARERDRAQRVAELLVDLFAGADPMEDRGGAFTPRTFLDRGTERIDRELAAEPEVRAELLGVAGRVYRNLGLYDRAASSLETSVALRASRWGPRHPEVAAGLVQLGEIRRLEGDYQSADSLLHRALEIFRRPETRDLMAEAATLSELALVRLDRGDPTGAERLLEEALELHGREDVVESPALAGVLETLAAVHLRRGELGQAESLLREALERRRRLLGPGDPTVGTTLERLGALLVEKEDHVSATEAWQEALELHREALGPDHPRVAATLERLGVAHLTRGDPHAAEAHLRESLAIRRDRLGRSHPDVARGLADLGLALQRAGRPSEAEAAYREARIIERHHGVTNDAWDLSGGTVVTGSSPLRLGPSESMFDGAPRSQVLFADFQPAGTVHFVEWRTPARRAIERFSLHAWHDSHVPPGPTPGCFRLPSPYQRHRDAHHRGIDRFTLRAWNPVTDAFDIILYDEEIRLEDDDHLHPGEGAKLYDVGAVWSGQSYLLLEANVRVVPTDRWRAEFRQLGCPSAESGPRIVELDGFER